MDFRLLLKHSFPFLFCFTNLEIDRSAMKDAAIVPTSKLYSIITFRSITSKKRVYRHMQWTSNSIVQVEFKKPRHISIQTTSIKILFIFLSFLQMGSQTLPSEKDTTAHFPVHAHLRDSLPPPPGSWRSFSSSPAGRPTTTSALQVRKARTRIPDLGPSGPIAVVKGVVGSHWAWVGTSQQEILTWKSVVI